MSDFPYNPETLLSLTVIPLMKGILQRQYDEKLWNQVLRLQSRIREYVGVLGLQLQIDEAEGFAWLSQKNFTQDEPTLPRLVTRHRLSYNLSLLLALLRRRLAEMDSQGGELRLILNLEEIQNLVALFLPNTGNEARRRDQVAAQIAKAEDLGFLRRVKNEVQIWEVQRILGLFIDAQWLAEFSQKLEVYRLEAQKELGEEDTE